MSLYNTIHDEILDEINREWDMYITSKAEQDLHLPFIGQTLVKLHYTV